MDDEIIYSWCFNSIECFDSTPSTTIIILVKNLKSLLSLRSQQYHIQLFLKVSVEEGTFHIHLSDLIVIVCSYGEKNHD